MVAILILEAPIRALTLVAISILFASCAKEPGPKQQTAAASSEAATATAASVPEPKASLGDTPPLVTAPAAGSPEAVIRSLLEAAMNPDEAAGWEATRSLLHSSMQTQRALKSYREMNYQASRRKVSLFTPDDTKPHFRVTRTDTLGGDKLKLFIHNEKSMPSPCILRKDAEAQGAWRIHVCAL